PCRCCHHRRSTPHFLHLPPVRTSPLGPYTTLFRSSPSEIIAFAARHLSSVRGTWGYPGFSASFTSARAIRPISRTAWSPPGSGIDRKSTRLNSSHVSRSYAVFCLKKKTQAHGG